MELRRGAAGKAAYAVGLFLAQALFARFGLLFSAGPDNLASIWPAAGLQVAALALGGRERRAITVAAVFAGNVAANLAGGNTPAVSLAFGAANLFEGLLAIAILDRFASPAIRFDNLRDTRVFLLLVVILGNALTGLLGAAVPAAAFGADFRHAWATWVLADGAGMLLVTPFLVEWAGEGAERLRRPDWRRLSEGALAFLVIAALFYVHVYPAEGTDRIHNAYVLFPFLAWITVRLGTLGTVTANMVVAALIGIHGIRQILVSGSPIADLVEQDQIFTAITSGTMLFLSAVFAERGRAKKALHLLNASLEAQVAERTEAAERRTLQLMETERAQRRLVEELRTTNAELDAFSSSVSHDLRAPLRGLRGFARAFREDCGDRLDERGRFFLDRMHEAAEAMDSVVGGLMAVSRVSRADIRRVPVDLAEIARDVAGELAVRYPDRAVEFVAPAGLPADADPRLVRLIVQNLLDNAWKFTRGRPDARIEIGQSDDGPEPGYFVRDNGAGFDMDFAGDLFAPFRRLHDVAEFPGTGIGLATVRRAVERHGGRIRAESAVGRGATFRFTLPPEGTVPPGDSKGPT